MKLKSLALSIGLGVFTAKVLLATTWVVLQTASTASPLTQLLALAGAVATSYALGLAKKTDTSITNSDVFRKLQPFITLGGAYAAPWLSAKLGVQVDPQAFAAAPLATIVTIGGLELGSLITKKTGGTS